MAKKNGALPMLVLAGGAAALFVALRARPAGGGTTEPPSGTLLGTPTIA